MRPVERVIEEALRDWTKRTELGEPGFSLSFFIATALRRAGLIDVRAELEGTIIPEEYFKPGGLTLVADQDVVGKPAPKPGPPGKQNQTKPTLSAVPTPKPRPKPSPTPAPRPKPQPPKK